MQNAVTAILLAAGSSRRMGRSKLLLPLGDKPVIRFILDTVLDSGIKEVIVVVRAGDGKIREVLRGLPVQVVENPDQGSQMADSVRLGRGCLQETATGLLICLGDHPLVSRATIRQLIALHLRRPDKILVPRYKGRGGHPTLFPRAVLSALTPGRTMRDVIRAATRGVEQIDVDDEGVVLDMDTPKEYERIVTIQGRRVE